MPGRAPSHRQLCQRMSLNGKMKTLNIVGSTANVTGLALWCYGYYVGGAPPIVNWPSIAPTWISEFLPNIEAELGMLLMCLAAGPLLWVSIRQNSGQ